MKKFTVIALLICALFIPQATMAASYDYPADTLYSFHRYITNREFNNAFYCLSYAYRSKMNYNSWVRGFDSTISSSVSDVYVEYRSSYYTTLNYVLTAVDYPNYTTRYRGRATLVWEDGMWRLDEIHNRRI